MKLPITQRTVHNDKLAREYFEKHGGASLYPRVSHQVSSIVVNPLALSKWGYNPTIARSGDKILMAYRWHEDNDYSTTLAVAELDENLNVHTNNPLEVKTDGRCSSVEDPRFFHYKGELWMSYVESNWPDKNPKCVVKYGRLIGGPPWKLDDITRVEYGKNGWDGMEKNWIFFEVGGQLMCHYKANLIITVNGDKVVGEQEVAVPKWAWGPVKGGTAEMPIGNTTFRFFHSSLDFDPRPNYRRYYIGALTSDGRISKRPIAIGSEDDDVDPKTRPDCLQFKPKVVFPGGVIAYKKGWLLSCGINDAESLLLKLTPEDLHL